MIIINALKIIFLLGFLVFIHESGHFFVAKLCKVRVNEFAIGFGPTIWRKQGKVTKYALRLIPLGGFVSMEGESERSNKEGSFSETSIPKRIAIVMAGGLVNIIFAVVAFWCLSACFVGPKNAFYNSGYFLKMMFEGIIQLFTGKAKIDQMMGPVGISSVVSNTSGFADFIYILSVISLSLGVTNLMPFPPLDGGKVVLLIIEAIIKRPLSQKTEVIIQSIGFCALITLSIFVTFNDIARLSVETSTEYSIIEDQSVLGSTKDINLHDLNGKKTNYVFTYKNTEFSAKYTKDNWHIKDSYKITNKNDIEIISQALIEVHPIHGKDLESYRTVDDLAYEWMQHNLAYAILPDDNYWKSHAKDVDLDPADQGRSLEEMYETRTGSKLDINKLKNSTQVQKIKNSSKLQKVINSSKVQKVKNSSKVQKLKNKLKQLKSQIEHT